MLEEERRAGGGSRLPLRAHLEQAEQGCPVALHNPSQDSPSPSSSRDAEPPPPAAAISSPPLPQPQRTAGLTKRTLIPRRLAIRTAPIIRDATDSADVVLVLVVRSFVGSFGGLGVRAEVPAPEGDGVVVVYCHFHRGELRGEWEERTRRSFAGCLLPTLLQTSSRSCDDRQRPRTARMLVLERLFTSSDRLNSLRQAAPAPTTACSSLSAA